MALAGTAALNWHWSWQQIADTPLAILILMWRQTAKASNQDNWMSLSEVENLDEIKKRVKNGSQRISKT